MDRSKAEFMIANLAQFNGVDPDLAIAIAEVESNFNEKAARFEANWKYAYNCESFARATGISEDTERIFQMCSWGMMQVMGTVARELGHRGPMLDLILPEVGIKFGCLKIREIMRKFSYEDDIIAAYNAGQPKKMPDGRYYNNVYVAKVRGILAQRRVNHKKP